MKVERDVDLLIVMGTALAVAPFCHLVECTKKSCPKVLINMSLTENYDFNDKEKYPERLFVKGKCDQTIYQIAKDCGWTDDLKAQI